MTGQSSFTGFQIAPTAKWSEEEASAEEQRLLNDGHFEGFPLDSQPTVGPSIVEELDQHPSLPQLRASLHPDSLLVTHGGKKVPRRGTGVVYEGLRLPPAIAFRFFGETPVIIAIKQAGPPARKHAPKRAAQ